MILLSIVSLRWSLKSVLPEHAGGYRDKGSESVGGNVDGGRASSIQYFRSYGELISHFR